MTSTSGLGDRADLAHALLLRRAWVPDGALLDCLELADWLGPGIRAGSTPLTLT